MKERFKIIPEVCVLVIKNNEILLSRRLNTGWEDGNYGLPAGHIEDGETMSEGAAREAHEEIGIEIDPKNLRHVHTQHRFADDPGNPHSRVGFYFVPTQYKGEIENKEPDKCSELKFFPLDQLPQNTIGHIRTAIECYRNGVTYSEFDWDKKK